MDESRLPRNPPSGLLPPFQSQHQASEFMAVNQCRGLLKRCAHLSIQPIDPESSLVFYQIRCAKDSFEVPAPPIEFMGSCPKQCRLYRPGLLALGEQFVNLRTRGLPSVQLFP